MATTTQYVASLRAINVAGHPRVEMTDLRAAFDRAGCRNVQTYIQSGNVLFDGGTDARRLFLAIRRSVGDLIGGVPAIVFRTACQALVTSGRPRQKRVNAARVLRDRRRFVVL